MWKPENYGKKFYGRSTLREGLEKSRNLMTVRISQDLGLDKIVNLSKKLGIYENPNELSINIFRISRNNTFKINISLLFFCKWWQTCKSKTNRSNSR